MKVLYLDQVSANPESSQQKTHQTVKGADVFSWNLLCALLEYGTYDAYLVQAPTEEKKRMLVEGGLPSRNFNRLTFIPPGAALPVRDSDEVIFLTAGRYLNVLAAIRQKWKRENSPVAGFIHSINSPRIALALLQQCFVGLSEADLLLCSSWAGMKTIDVYAKKINHLLPRELHYPVRRVLVPLGVNIPVALQGARSSLRQRLNIGPHTPIAMYFGRLSQASKCDLGPLLVAFSQLLKRGKNLCLIVAGDDTQAQESPRLQALVCELGCQENTRIWANPSAQEKHLLYSGTDFFVSPSDNMQETFGIALAEAMAYGLPAVVSDWDGYRDLVKDGETGFLVPSVLPSLVEELCLSDCATSMFEEDSLAQSTTVDVTVLSDRMERLAIDSSLRMQMGQAARGFIESYCSWQVVVKRYEELWEQSLAVSGTKNSRPSKPDHLLNLSLEDCFGHYASDKRTPKEKCFVTAEGQEWLKRPGRFYFLRRSLSTPCPQQFQSMLQAISDHPGISIGEAAEAFLKDPSSNDIGSGKWEEAHWMLGRLHKYGLVTEKKPSLTKQ